MINQYEVHVSNWGPESHEGNGDTLEEANKIAEKLRVEGYGPIKIELVYRFYVLGWRIELRKEIKWSTTSKFKT